MRLCCLLALVSTFSWGQTTLRGLEWEDDVYKQLPLKAAYFSPADKFPSAVSLKDYCPRVVTQASTNTGVAWAAVWYGRTISEAVSSKMKGATLVTQHAYSPGFNYRPDTRGGCDSPIRLSTVLSSLHDDGAIPFAVFQETCKPDSISADIATEALTNRLAGFVRLFNTNDTEEVKVRSIKSAIAAGHPVVLGIICPPSFSLAQDFWQPREDPNRDFGGHAVCVVGYDDQSYGGSVEIVNSWGKSWGRDGFTALRYDDIDRFAIYGFELIPSPPKAERMFAAVTFKKGGTELMSARLRNNGYYKLSRPWPSGTQFQVTTQFGADVFFYAIAFDEQLNHEVLYPPEHGVYSWLSKDDSPVVLPDKAHMITLTEPAGKNYMLLALSGRQMKVEEMLTRIKNGNHDLASSVQTMNGSTQIEWKPDAIAIATDWTQNSFVTIIVEIDQVH